MIFNFNVTITIKIFHLGNLKYFPPNHNNYNFHNKIYQNNKSISLT